MTKNHSSVPVRCPNLICLAAPKSFHGDPGLVEQHLDLGDFAFVASAFSHGIQGREITADDLVLGGLAAHLVVADAEAHHVHTHIRRRLVGTFPVDAVKQGIQHRENLDVAVVVDGDGAIGIEMERVDHVHVVEIGCSGLVCHIDGMFQRQAPHGEGLKLGVARVDAAFLLVVELAEAHGHLAAARTGCRDDDQGPRGLHVVVLSKSIVGVDQTSQSEVRDGC